MDARSLTAEDRKDESRLPPKKMRLLKRTEYKNLFRSSKRRVGKFVSIDFLQGNKPYPRLGITTPVRFGKAHDRNRFKRIVREAFTKALPLLSEGMEINIFPRAYAKGAKMQDIYQEIIHLL